MIMSNISIIFDRLARGEEITTEERDAAASYLASLPTLRHKAPVAEEPATAAVEPNDQEHTTVHLPDGRAVDVFPSGDVHVYAAGLSSAYELTLPQVDRAATPIRTLPLG
jgi:hypothetical protein